jgi:hypothetical protein
MEIQCFIRLSEEQVKNLPKGYVAPPIEGTYLINDEHSDGVMLIYVGYCNWKDDYEKCLREFVLTVFHESLHVLLPELENCIPYAERIFAEMLDNPRLVEENDSENKSSIDLQLSFA